MKKQTLNPVINLSQEELETLTSQVKETLAKGITIIPNEKVFTAADLWNIQRRKRALAVRRYL